MASTLHSAAQLPPSPITAPWAIAEAAKLGGDFLQWLLCAAGPTRRQLTFALGARGWLANPEGIVAQVRPDRMKEACEALCDLLQRGKIEDLVRAAFGFVPEGFIPALKRLGSDALADPAKYQSFFEMFSDRRHRARARVASHLGRLTEEKLDILFAVDPALLHPTVIQRSTRLDEVLVLNAALEAIRSATDPSDEDALVSAATTGSCDRPISRIITTWISRCRLAPLPFGADPEAGVQPLTTASELMAASKRFRNCARSLHRVIDAIAGRAGYVVQEAEGKPVAMSALVRFDDGVWHLENIYGPANAPLTPTVKEPLRQWFRDRGIASMRLAPLKPGWQEALSLAGSRPWTEGFDLE